MNILAEALDFQDKNIPFATATIVSAKGSRPRTNMKDSDDCMTALKNTVFSGDSCIFLFTTSLTIQ